MLKYIPEYGMIFDTISSLMLLCNPGNVEQVKKDTGLCNENVEWIQDNLKAPGEIMNVFFSVNSGKARSFMQYFFCTNTVSLTTCSMDRFCEDVLVKDKVLSSMMEYYFSTICYDFDGSNIRKMILQSSYDSNLKLHIWGVFCETDYYLEELIACLKENYNKVAYYYKSNVEALKEFEGQITEETFFDIDHKLQHYTKYRTIYYTIVMLSESILSRRGLGYEEDKENVIFIIGPHWKGRFQAYLHKKELNLVTFGKILSEENRYKIIQYLLKYKEITISEAVKLLDASLTATNYHLNMMAAEKMLVHRNEGRKLFFSLNREYFERAINEIHSLMEQI